MGGGASKISAAAENYMTEKCDPEMAEEAEGDDDNDDNHDEDDDKTVWENGLLDLGSLGSKTFDCDDFEQSLSDSETMVGNQRASRRRTRSQSWSHPIRERASKVVKRSFICCTGNSVALNVSVNFKPHISDLADVMG